MMINILILVLAVNGGLYMGAILHSYYAGLRNENL